MYENIVMKQVILKEENWMGKNQKCRVCHSESKNICELSVKENEITRVITELKKKATCNIITIAIYRQVMET